MKRKVLVIDNLTETFNGSRVKSGLQKSAKLDAQAISQFHDVSFAYCGHIDDPKYNYKHIVVDTVGTKDRAMEERDDSKLSKLYVRKYLSKLSEPIEGADLIIVHCHSLGMLNAINEFTRNKNILFIIHDVIDWSWANGFCGAVKRLQAKKRNNCKVLANSQYTIDRLTAIYKREPKGTYPGDEIFDGFIDHFVWTDQRPTEDDILNKVNESAIIGRYESHKYHHKVYGYENENNKIIHYGMKDPRRDPGLRYYERLKQKSNGYREALSDDDLWANIKRAKSVILPCFHEGFGYTAFEAGIFGVVPVILAKPLSPGEDISHATNEYLERCHVTHFMSNYNDTEDFFDKIDKSLEISDEMRLQISKNLLEYFSVENYVNERLSYIKEDLNVPLQSGAQINLFDLL